jgi:hypothetical protein
MQAALLLNQFASGGTPLQDLMATICGVLYQAQQEFFYYLAKAKTAALVLTRPLLPTYAQIIKEVEMQTYNISKMPASWTRYLTTPKETKSFSSKAKPKAATSKPNLKPDLVLQKCYKDAESPNLGAMMGSNADKIPKVGSSDVCLSWTLQGQCHSNCPHKANHREIGADATSSLHDFLDIWQVIGDDILIVDTPASSWVWDSQVWVMHDPDHA